MATSKAGGTASPKGTGAKAAFVTSAGGTAVRPAKDRGETSVGPSHCVSTRKHFPTSYR